MKFPTHIRTKRHALELAGEMFPGLEKAIGEVRAQYPSGILFDIPFTVVESNANTRMKLFLEWLYDDDGRMRVYRRPRWWLLEMVVKNFTDLLRANREAQDRYYHTEHWKAAYGRESFINQFQDGDGI